MSCRTGCPTPGSHESWGACARASDLQIDKHALAGHRPAELDKDKRLTRYAEARSQGLQPRSTGWSDVRRSFEDGGIPKDAPSVNGGIQK